MSCLGVLFLSSYKLVDNELFNERRIRKKRKEKNQHLSFFPYPEYLVKVTHLLIPIVTKPKKESTMFTNGYTTSMVPYDGTSMELSRRSDPGEFNLLLLINFVAIASTFYMLCFDSCPNCGTIMRLQHYISRRLASSGYPLRSGFVEFQRTSHPLR